jgi:hypothetical protein
MDIPAGTTALDEAVFNANLGMAKLMAEEGCDVHGF